MATLLMKQSFQKNDVDLGLNEVPKIKSFFIHLFTYFSTLLGLFLLFTLKP